MRYLLDTCTISEIFKETPDSSVDAWWRSTNQEDMYLSVLTLGELEKGIQKIKEGKRRDALSNWARELGEQFHERILPVDEIVALAWGTLQAETEKKGRPLPAIDGLLAATAHVHDLTVVTRDCQDIEATDVPLLNPWKHSA